MTLAALSARTAATLARIERLLALNEAEPLRSHKAATLLPKGQWLTSWEREGVDLVTYLGICADLDCEE